MSLPDSCFVSMEIHPRQVALADGCEHTIHFKELPAAEFRAWREREVADEESVRMSAISRLLVAGVCNPDGTAALTFSQAKLLKAGPMGALLAALLEVNGVGAAPQEKQGNE